MPAGRVRQIKKAGVKPRPGRSDRNRRPAVTGAGCRCRRRTSRRWRGRGPPGGDDGCQVGGGKQATGAFQGRSDHAFDPASRGPAGQFQAGQESALAGRLDDQAADGGAGQAVGSEKSARGFVEGEGGRDALLEGAEGRQGGRRRGSSRDSTGRSRQASRNRRAAASSQLRLASRRRPTPAGSRAASSPRRVISSAGAPARP